MGPQFYIGPVQASLGGLGVEEDVFQTEVLRAKVGRGQQDKGPEVEPTWLAKVELGSAESRHDE